MKTEERVEKCAKTFGYVRVASERASELPVAVCCAKRKTVLKSYLRAFVAVHANALRFSSLFPLLLHHFVREGVKGREEEKMKNEIHQFNANLPFFVCIPIWRAVVKEQSGGDTRIHTHPGTAHASLGARAKAQNKNEIIRIYALYSRTHIRAYIFLFWFKIPSAYYDAFYIYFMKKTRNLTHAYTGSERARAEKMKEESTWNMRRFYAQHTVPSSFSTFSDHTQRTHHTWIRCSLLLLLPSLIYEFEHFYFE